MTRPIALGADRRRPLRRAIGAGAIVSLIALGAAMAAAGPDVVPAAGRGGDPGWVEGIFGGGLGIDGDLYIWLERAALLAYVAVLVCAATIPGRLLWTAIAVLIGLFALAPPLLSLDVFSYAAYARLDGLHDLNPYEVGPAGAPGDDALPFIEDWREKTSVYGPLFSLITLPLAGVGLAASIWALKAVAAISLLAIAAIVARLAALRGLDPGFAAALVGLNPLVLVHVVGGAHNDALMAALMTAAVAAIALARPLAGGIGLAAAAAVKASAAIAAPFAMLGAERRGRLALGLIGGAGALAAIGLALFGPAVEEALKVGGQSQGVATRASFPGTLSRELELDLDAVRATSIALWAVGMAALLVWTARGADWIRALGWALVGLLAAASYLTPWYVVWALPAVAISRDRGLVVATIALTAFLLREQVPGLGG